jgi:hypothetical protein
LCRDETRTSEHIGISPAEEGWTVANDNERYLVAALTCNVLQQTSMPFFSFFRRICQAQRFIWTQDLRPLEMLRGILH